MPLLSVFMYSALKKHFTRKGVEVLLRWKVLGSSGAGGAVNPPRQVGDHSLFDQALQQFGLSVHVVRGLLQHGGHGQVVVVVQRRPQLGEVVSEACQADLVAQQAG